MPAVFCPICRIRINEGLHSVTPHLQNIHGVYVTRPHPKGFYCRQPGCRSWFAVFKTWQRHIRVAHESGLDYGANLVDVDVHEVADPAEPVRSVDDGADFVHVEVNDIKL